MQRTVGRHIRGLDPEVRQLLWHLVIHWNNLVCSQRHPDISASTNRLEGWFVDASSPRR